MTPVTLIPDAEKTVHAFLSAHADVVALDTRIVGKTPDSTDESWVQIMQIDARNAPDSRVEHLIEYLIQVDAYASKAGINGSPQREASLIARTVRAALHDALPGQHTEGVVTSVRLNSMRRLPDTELEPARERFFFTATIHMHI